MLSNVPPSISATANSTTLDFYRQFQQWLVVGPVVLATVTQVAGSAPREVGAKMLICADGSTIATIGGGAAEAKVMAQAQQVLATGEKQWVTIDLSGVPQRATQGVCGGSMQVWLERWQGDGAIALIQRLVAKLEAGQTVWLVTPFAADQVPYLSDEGQAQTHDRGSCFREQLAPPPTLLIVGAGHVAVPLAQVTHLADFRVVVQDDRPEFANSTRFPTADSIWHESIAIAFAALPPIAELYVALVTRSYTHDLDALRSLTSRPLAYLGMIGSKKRIHTVLHTLAQEEAMAQWLAAQPLYAPIGLDIGALTPAEIAVSICAELIQVRRRGAEILQSLDSRLMALPSNGIMAIERPSLLDQEHV